MVLENFGWMEYTMNPSIVVYTRFSFDIVQSNYWLFQTERFLKREPPSNRAFPLNR